MKRKQEWVVTFECDINDTYETTVSAAGFKHAENLARVDLRGQVGDRAAGQFDVTKIIRLDRLGLEP